MRAILRGCGDVFPVLIGIAAIVVGFALIAGSSGVGGAVGLLMVLVGLFDALFALYVIGDTHR